MKEIDRRVAALAARQHGVVSRDQAIQLGLDQSALWRRTNGGSLIALGPNSLLVPGQTLTWRGELTAGVLDLGSDALVSAASAARLLDLDGFDAEALDYLVPRSQRGRVTKGRVSSSGDISRLDRITIDGLPCTSATRTVVELLKLGTLEEAGRALDSACRRRLTAHAAVRRRLDELGRQGRPGVAAFDELVRTGTVESWLERRFIDVIRRARLPVPTLQQRYELPAFGIARVDFEYPLWGIVIEVGGQRGYLSVDERQRQAPTERVATRRTHHLLLHPRRCRPSRVVHHQHRRPSPRHRAIAARSARHRLIAPCTSAYARLSCENANSAF